MVQLELACLLGFYGNGRIFGARKDREGLEVIKQRIMQEIEATNHTNPALKKDVEEGILYCEGYRVENLTEKLKELGHRIGEDGIIRDLNGVRTCGGCYFYQ